MLDCSPKKIKEYSKKHDFDFWQLRTPLTNYKSSNRPYGLDNGCFSSFNETRWLRLIAEAKINPPVFVTLPDIVGDARRTGELFINYLSVTDSLPRALVLQDGVGEVDIPWHLISAVFVGGSDAFKISAECVAVCKTAKILGKWIHVGRVNTMERVDNWVGLCDSIDGSGLSRYDHMLEAILFEIKGDGHQLKLNYSDTCS